MTDVIPIEGKEGLSPEMISMLQTIRRANQGIVASVEILNENDANQGSVPVQIRPWILLEPNQEMGLLFAIQACSSVITDLFNGPLEDAGVYWNEDWMPELVAEAAAIQKLDRGEMSFEEFKEDRGMDPRIQ